MAIDIKAATAKDLEGILDIYNDAILNTTAVYNYKPHTLEMRKQWFDEKQEKGLPILVAVENDAVIGFATYGPYRPWAAYKYTVESSVYISPHHKGKGIAKLLYAALIAKAEEQDVHTIVAGIDADNAISIKLHEHFGFKQVAHFKEVGYKFDKWLDLVFMQLILTTPHAPTGE